MKISVRAPRGAVFILLALAAAVLISACGGSSSSSSSSSTTKRTSSTTSSAASASSAEAAFRACLKSHGLNLPSGGFGRRPGGGTGTFTRPAGAPPTGGYPGGGFGGGGFAGGEGGGFAGGNSKFATAFRDCASKLPKGSRFGRFGGGFGGGGSPARVKFSTKTLDSYVACIRSHGYPSMPNPNTSGTGPTFPASVESNPKFQTANKSCESILTSAFRSAAGGAAPPGAPASTTSATSST